MSDPLITVRAEGVAYKIAQLYGNMNMPRGEVIDLIEAALLELQEELIDDK